MLVADHLEPFLAIAHEIITAAGGEHFISNKLLNYSIKIFINMWSNPEARPKIEAALDSFIYEPALNAIKLTPKDMELWRENQVEYVRRHEDFRESLFFARNSMVDFIILATRPIKKKQEASRLEKYLKFCYDKLVSSSTDILTREAVLLIIGHLSEQVGKIPAFFNGLGPVIRDFVIPGLRSENGFLRCRSTWVLQKYENFKWN